MQVPKFEEYGECGRCRKTAPLTSNGICQSCLEYLIVVRADPFSRAKELKRIAQSENGVIQFAHANSARPIVSGKSRAYVCAGTDGVS
jgi:hypothetical protein